MSNDTAAPIWESLEAFARTKIQQFIQSLLEEEVTSLLGRARAERRAAVDAPAGYRNGHGKPRRLSMQGGTITLRRPRVRGTQGSFESKILPLFARRTTEVGKLLPELYLHGLALGDFELALRGLLGEGAPLSASSILRLKAEWQAQYAAWRAGGEPGRFLERPAERGFRVVTHVRADRGDLGAALGQEVSRDLHPPLGQVLHRRLANEQGESLGQAGTGRSSFPSQLGEGPGMIGPRMEERQHPTDHLVMEAGEPAGLSRRQVLEIATKHLDEHQLSQSGEDANGAGRPAVAAEKPANERRATWSVVAEKDDVGV